MASRKMLALGAAACVVTVAAEKYGATGEYESATASSEPHMTTAGTLGFLLDSVALAKALTAFAATSTFSLVWEHVPADMQKEVVKKVDEVSGVIKTQCLKNGVAAPHTWSSKIHASYQKVAKPHLDMVYGMADKMVAAPASKFITPLLAKFEAKHPEQAGKLPAHLFDLLLCAFFLMYFVVGTFYNLFCTVVCCGCCKKRSKGQPELVKSKKGAASIPSGKKKN